MEDKTFRFVLKYYDNTKFDTDKAIVQFRRSAGLAVNEHPDEAFSGRSGGSHNIPDNDGRRIRKIAFHVASVVAVLTLFAVSFAVWRNQWLEYKAIDVAQTFVLPDSSAVTLAPGAVLRVRPYKDTRLVYMTGKVYFDVRHDEAKPFRVIAGDGFVKVLGTRFQVLQSDVAVVVDVVSGKVLFASSESREGFTMTAGMSAELSDNESVPKLMVDKSLNPAVWATNEFVYSDAPLGEVIKELEEYYGISLSVNVLSGAKWQDRRLTARLEAADLSEILSLIESALDVMISR